MISDYSTLPPGLPEPEDDGAADHLEAMPVASAPLPATSGDTVDLSSLHGRTVVYCYPMTGAPDNPTPDDWDMIPGARGCTPQSCAFRDHYQEIRDLGADVYGLSTQTTRYQREAVERLHLPFELLSDVDREFAGAMRLPTFEIDRLPRGVGSSMLVKRLTMILNGGAVEKVFYPVFPPDRDAESVLAWLRLNPGGRC
ncbi:MAG: peroxiredoxin [Thermomicrobiales bacterium]